MKMHIRVAHVGAVEDQRVIQQRAVPIGRVLQLVQIVGQALHVIAVDLGVILDAIRVLRVVRSAMETCVGAAGRETAAGQIAGIEHGRHARDVRLEGQSL